MKKTIIYVSLWSTLINGAAFAQKDPVSSTLPAYDQDERGRNSFPQTWDVDGKKLFIFNPKVAAWAVYNEDGERVMTGGASGGKDYCSDIDEPCRTVTGNFSVYRKEGEDCISSTYPIATEDQGPGGAPMPYCMYFHHGYAIHGSNHVPRTNASHGCVRVFPDAARWLNEEFIDIGTKVLILSYP